MEKRVNIVFKSRVANDDDVMEHAHEVEGIVYYEDGAIVQIEFADYAEHAEHVNTQVTFFLEENTVTMQRTGDSVMEQKYELGTRHRGLYQTEHGKFATAAETEVLNYQEDTSGCTLLLMYHYFVADVKTGIVTIDLQIEIPVMH